MPSAHQFLFRMNFGSQESVALFNVSTLLFDLNRIYVSGCSEVDREIARKSPQNRNRYRVAEGLELRVARIRFEVAVIAGLDKSSRPKFCRRRRYRRRRVGAGSGAREACLAGADTPAGDSQRSQD